MTSDPSKDSTSTAEKTTDPVKDTTGDNRTSKTTEPSGVTTKTDQTGASETRTKRLVTCDPGVDQNMTSHPGTDRPRKRTRVQAAASRLLPISSGASESCSEVLHRMNQDHVSHQV